MNTQIVLAHEELLYLMQIMNIVTLPGFGGAPLITMDEETYLQIMGVAERCLRAKGFLAIDNNTLVVETAVAGTLSYCARNPAAVIGIRRELPRVDADAPAPQAAVFHAYNPHLLIKHVQELGLHHFVLYPDKTAMLNEMIAWMSGGLPVAEPEVIPESLEVTGAALVAARATLFNNQFDDALTYKMLTAASYASDTAASVTTLIRDQAQAVITLSFAPLPAVLQSSPNPKADKVLTFLQTPNGWCLLTPHPDTAAANNPTYHIEVCTTDSVKTELTGLLP